MQDVYMQDPTFINFVPRTAGEAVDRFTRCRRRGLSAYRIPECVIECARRLPPHEMDRFEQWLINPNNVDITNVHPNNTITDENEEVRKTVYDRVYGDEMKAEGFPPIPNVQDLDDIMRTESSAQCRPDFGDEKAPDPPSSAISLASTPAVPPVPASAPAAPPPSPVPSCAAL